MHAETRPRKRIVSLQEYLDTKIGTGIGFSFALIACLLGIACLVFAGFLVWMGNFAYEGAWPDTATRVVALVLGSLFCVPALASFWAAAVLFKSFREIEPVELLTKESAKRLPEGETLVRASDRPAIHEPSELLRAAKTGEETPSEQLLRVAPAPRHRL